MKFFTIILIVWQHIFVQAQSVSTQMGARAAGMGNTSATFTDGTGIFNNPGGLNLEIPLAFFAYEVTPQLPGANRMAAAITLPLKVGVAAAGIFRFGDDLYSEQVASVGFGSKVGITSLGLKANYVQYQAQGYQTQHAMSFSFGGITAITKQISIGAYITNLNQAQIVDGELLPTKLIAGVSIRPTESFLASTEIEKDLTYGATWRTGAEYSVNRKIFFRSGFNINPSAGFFGVGMNANRMTCDFAIKLSQIPGNSFQASASYKLRSAKNR